MSYTVRKTWHYGNDYRVTEHTAATLSEALYGVVNPEMPAWALEAALTALRNGDAYRGWSWAMFELVEPTTTPEPTAHRSSSQAGLASFRNPSNICR